MKSSGKKMFISTEDSGFSYYSMYAENLKDSLKELGFDVQVLRMPELYKSEIAKKQIGDFSQNMRPVHFIMRPLSKIRFLDGAKNVVFILESEPSQISDFAIDLLRKTDELIVISSEVSSFLVNAGINSKKIKEFSISSICKDYNKTDLGKKKDLPRIVSLKALLACYEKKLDEELYPPGSDQFSIVRASVLTMVIDAVEREFKGDPAALVISKIANFLRRVRYAPIFQKRINRSLSVTIKNIPKEIVLGPSNWSWNVVCSIKNNSKTPFRISSAFPDYLRYSFTNISDRSESYVDQIKYSKDTFIMPGRQEEILLSMRLPFEMKDGIYNFKAEYSLDNHKYFDINDNIKIKVTYDKNGADNILKKKDFKLAVVSSVNLNALTYILMGNKILVWCKDLRSIMKVVWRMADTINKISSENIYFVLEPMSRENLRINYSLCTDYLSLGNSEIIESCDAVINGNLKLSGCELDAVMNQTTENLTELLKKLLAK